MAKLFPNPRDLSVIENTQLMAPSQFGHVITDAAEYDPTAQTVPHYIRLIRVGDGGTGNIAVDVVNANGTGGVEKVTFNNVAAGSEIRDCLIAKVYNAAGGTTATKLFVC